jgi:L-asparaginase II
MEKSHSSPALLAEVTRNGWVESRHWGHVAVVDRHGHLFFSAGDPNIPIFPRSSLKPLQALAGVARGTAREYQLTPAEIAVTCASHAAEPRHREAVARILTKIGAAESDLHCGPHPVPHLPSRDALIREGREPTPIYSNCSGKHSGMLALARVLDAPLTGYWEPEHPVQREVQRVLAAFCGTHLSSLTWGTDGCGVPTYRLPLRELALGFARLAAPTDAAPADADAAATITSAMNAEPEMVRGEGGFDSVLMRGVPGRFASKGGAEGCHALAVLDRGLGIAVKIEDGNPRAIPPLILSLLRRLEALPEPLAPPLLPLLQPEVPNTRGEIVGAIRIVV